MIVDGQVPQFGGSIQVYTWGGFVCGSAKVYALGGSAFFIIDIHTELSKPGCFEGGDPMIFKFNGMKAQEIPVFNQWGGEHTLMLSFKSTPPVRYFECTPQLCPLSSPARVRAASGLTLSGATLPEQSYSGIRDVSSWPNPWD